MAATVFNQAQLELLDMMQWVKSPEALSELWFLSQEGTGRIRCNVGAWGNDRRKAEELWDIAQKNSLSPIVMNIVLDTNCLVIAISRQSEYHQVWQDFLAGKLIIKDHTMAALGLGGKPYKKIKVTHLIWCATFLNDMPSCPWFTTNFNAVAADLRQKRPVFAPDLKQMRMFRRNIISKLEAWKQDKKHKKSPARNRVGDVCVIKLTLCQLQRADALSYLLNGTIDNAFLLCIERVNITTNLWAVETLREPCCTFAEVFLCDHCLSRNGAWTQKHSWYGCWHEWQFRFLVQRLTWQLLVP